VELWTTSPPYSLFELGSIPYKERYLMASRPPSSLSLARLSSSFVCHAPFHGSQVIGITNFPIFGLHLYYFFSFRLKITREALFPWTILCNGGYPQFLAARTQPRPAHQISWFLCRKIMPTRQTGQRVVSFPATTGFGLELKRSRYKVSHFRRPVENDNVCLMAKGQSQSEKVPICGRVAP
jgi:hypothetical protein